MYYTLRSSSSALVTLLVTTGSRVKVKSAGVLLSVGILDRDVKVSTCLWLDDIGSSSILQFVEQDYPATGPPVPSPRRLHSCRASLDALVMRFLGGRKKHSPQTTRSSPTCDQDEQHDTRQSSPISDNAPRLDPLIFGTPRRPSRSRNTVALGRSGSLYSKKLQPTYSSRLSGAICRISTWSALLTSRSFSAGRTVPSVQVAFLQIDAHYFAQVGLR